jgi:hypothetical protein
MLYVPFPPFPVPKEEIVVLAATPLPITTMLGYIWPDEMAVTVNTVPEIEPVKATGFSKSLHNDRRTAEPLKTEFPLLSRI